jgi:putative membrane protein
MKLHYRYFCTVAAVGLGLSLTPVSVAAQTAGGAQSPTGGAQGPGGMQNPQNPGGMQNPTTMPSTAGAQSSGDQNTDAGSQKMAKSPDVAFVMKAAQGGLAEVQLGKLAAEKAGSPDVKSFGQMMVDDHTKANDQLKAVAQKENMTIPTTLKPKDQALYDKLQNMSGADFDKTYVKAMVKDHQEDVKEFQKEASKGKNEQVKQFASTTLPILQTHLDKIKQIQSGMKGKGGGAAGTASGS